MHATAMMILPKSIGML